MLSKGALSFTSLLVVASALAPFVAATKQSGSLGHFRISNDNSETSDDKVFWLKPGMSYCNVTYRDESEVACVKDYWVDPKQQDSCQRFVLITNPLTGVSAHAQVLDKCGDVKNSTFGINDIYVSLKTFKKLSSDRYAKNKEAGNLQTQVRWEFVVESCQACASGIFARDEYGREDKCKGEDSFGLQRCGRKKGDARAKTQDEVDAVCNYAYKCPKDDDDDGGDDCKDDDNSSSDDKSTTDSTTSST